ncbi:MAG: hypothetical protein H6907_13910 [Hyphomicrobiales bacterium]|nr:hypothetical protein [Hyphomicrobiales bacterium]MCP5372818.1 hypothetical protein [Hyphomicrobiales bacterium]
MAVAWAMAAGAPPARAEGQAHKLVIHVDENDKTKMTIALNIVEQTVKLWQDRGDTVTFEIVAHGPGLHMLRADTSPVKKRIGLMSTEIDNLSFSACANTLRKQEAKEGKTVPLVPEARTVPGGVFRIMQLQEMGYSYVRP